MEASLELRVIGLFVILISSVLGVLTPTLVKFLGGAATGNSSSEPANEGEAPKPAGLNYKHLIKLLSAIGCGCIIATALCHIAPPAISNLEEAWGSGDSHAEHAEEIHGSESHGSHEEEGHEEEAGHGGGHSHGFPYALAIATGSMLLLYIFENELSNLVTRFQHTRAEPVKADESKKDADDVTMAAVVAVDHHDCHDDHAHAVEVSEHERALATRNAIITHVLEIGVAVHSVLVGLALGLISDEGEARSLLIALCFHQYCEGCAVGASILESGLGLCHSAILWAIFSLTTPLGVAIGIAVEQSQGSHGSEGHDLLISQGVLESIALGVLLYMVVDMLPNLFNLDGCGGHSHHHHHHHDEAEKGTGSVSKPHHVQESGSMDVPCWYRVVLYGCLLFGAGIMVLIANWA